jgi:hypothetical protein
MLLTLLWMYVLSPYDNKLSTLFVRYNHDPNPRPAEFSAPFPQIRAAEVMFIRQIQKLMFDVFYEHISFLVMNSSIADVRYVHYSHLSHFFCLSGNLQLCFCERLNSYFVISVV